MKGYVYVLTNESMPGIVKVGRSIHGGKKRARDLYLGTTGVPSPFTLDFEMMFDDCVEAELLVHERLARSRVSADREFFKVDSYDATIAVITVFAEMLDYAVSYSDFCVDEQALRYLADKISLPGECMNSLTADIADAIAEEIDEVALRAAVKKVRIKRAARLKSVSKERYQNYIEAFPEAAAIEIVK